MITLQDIINIPRNHTEPANTYIIFQSEGKCEIRQYLNVKLPVNYQLIIACFTGETILIK